MRNFNSEESMHLFLVNPNLGHPIFLSIDPELKTTEFETCALFISDIDDPKKFEEYIRDKIKLVPILEYKWKLKILLEKAKKEQKRWESEIKELKMGIWKKIKKKLFHKQKSNKKSKSPAFLETNSSEVSLSAKLEEKLKRLKPRAFRGEEIAPIILKVQQISFTTISDLDYDDYCSPQDYLIKEDVFGTLEKFYKVNLFFALTEEVLEFLKKRNFLMFDIVQEYRGSKNRINYHSIVISKNEWKDFSLVHATDLHIAERNDEFYGIINEWKQMFGRNYLQEIVQTKDKTKSKPKSPTKKKFSLAIESTKPLNRRLINPNNNFRYFIKLMNRKVLQNDLDFIVLTGDLVDFTLLSKLPKDARKFVDFDYDHSNWKVFKEIVLNFPHKKRRGVIKSEELLCPIFTIPGNHDFRPYHYDLRWGGLYRKIGLFANEAIALNDKLFANPISAIIKSFRALRAYWSEVNPSLDYSLRLGNNLFVFLNSGSDSFKNIRDLLNGSPSVTGLTNRQIKYLENLVYHKIQENDNVYLFLHGPPINPKSKIGIFKRIGQKFFSKSFVTQIEELKESFLRKIGKKLTDARIDVKFDLKFGTISSNWEKLIEFCKDYCILTLAGHTHELKEFRLGEPKEAKSKFFNAPPFSFKKVENPAAVYYDLYSEIYSSVEDEEKKMHLVLQTPSLGLGSYKNPKMAGGYREIKVKEGKLNSFKVKFINR